MAQKNARALAADILKKIETADAYASFSLKAALAEASLPDLRDAALVTSLVYGVIERKLTLDYDLALYLRRPLKKMHPYVLSVLRLGAYQILFLQKIPVSAAVNESVALVKNGGHAYAAGLVNAVLRQVGKNGLILPSEDDELYLSVKYSCPKPLIDRLCAAYGQNDACKALEAALLPRPLFIRGNPIRCSDKDLPSVLAADGVKASACSLPHSFILEDPGDITALDAFRKGLFHVQDLSSQLCVAALGARKGETVIDCCSAPGGKTFSVAEDMADTGTVYACDLYPHKTHLVEEGAARLGLRCIRTITADARTLPGRFSGADRVLCDMPCSGLGVIGRKPEIRYKSAAEIDALPPLQEEILTAAAQLLRPGGVLVYSTCTLNPAENEEVCRLFLEKNPAFSSAADDAYLALTDGAPYKTVMLTPQGGDGIFFAKFVRADHN